MLNAANAELVSTEELQTLTLDAAREKYGIPFPDFLKLDVEGAELAVLRGAEMLLREHQPEIYVEVSRSSDGGCSVPV